MTSSTAAGLRPLRKTSSIAAPGSRASRASFAADWRERLTWLQIPGRLAQSIDSVSAGVSGPRKAGDGVTHSGGCKQYATRKKPRA